MKLPSKTHLRRPATLLLTWILLISCSLLPLQAESMTTPAAVPDQTTGEATLLSGQAPGMTATTSAPADQGSASVTPAPESTATHGPYSLEISDRYEFFTTKTIMGASLAASPGKVWLGTMFGTIEEVDAQSGAFGQSIVLPGGGSKSVAYPVMKLAFEGQYLWAWADIIENVHDQWLFAIDSGSGTIVHQWDLNSHEWLGNEERGYIAEDFGISPGKIWMDDHVIDTQTFEVTPDIPMPTMTLFAYNGIDWMWMTGDNGGSCDDLLLVGSDDPANDHWCPSDWPFLRRSQEGSHVTGPGSPMVLTGDRMWIAGGWAGTAPTYWLEAYWADMDLAMHETGPLASVPLLDAESKVTMLYTGNTLWVVYHGGDYAGTLYQLDPQTGETINSLDLVGDQGRSSGDIPMAMASEGDNLWILTYNQLLRIRMP